MESVKNVSNFILQRRVSFVFTFGSIIYGMYHFLYPNVLIEAVSFEALKYVLGVIGGRNLGLLYIVLGSIKSYGLFTDNKYLKLPLYFALLFLWLLLSVCFLITSILGHPNTSWILTGIIALMSTSIIENKNPNIMGG